MDINLLEKNALDIVLDAIKRDAECTINNTTDVMKVSGIESHTEYNRELKESVAELYASAKHIESKYIDLLYAIENLPVIGRWIIKKVRP